MPATYPWAADGVRWYISRGGLTLQDTECDDAWICVQNPTDLGAMQ
jgi:hypothetical protein